MVLHKGQYHFLTGNQIAAILLDHLITTRVATGSLTADKTVVVKTLSTSNIITRLCQSHGVLIMNTHVGFKYISQQIREIEKAGTHTFLFGCEDSHGYLADTLTRDKDGIMSSLLLAEAAAIRKTKKNAS